MRSFILKRPIVFFVLINLCFLLFAIFTIRDNMYYLVPFWMLAGVLNRKLLDYCNSDHENSKLEVIVTCILIIVLTYSFHDLHIKDELIMKGN